ncbi:MAG TPA: TolC family protein, partial [Novosphingobium sp.]|nr:TolC family protein [Novosphingobium sp.]
MNRRINTDSDMSLANIPSLSANMARCGGLALALALAACKAGPDYHGPAAAVPAPAAFARASGIAGETGAAPAPRWWHGLGDPVLDALEAQALAGNPSLAAAAARLGQARASLKQDKARLLPTVGAMGAVMHADLPGTGIGGVDTLNFYNAALDASWELDLFGKQRRTVEAGRASADAAADRVADAQVSLAAEVAQDYVLLRQRQQRLAAQRHVVERLEAEMGLVRQRVAQGTAADADVARLARQLEEARQALATLSADRAAYLDALAVLAGVAPGALDALLAPVGVDEGHLAVPLPPAAVAVGDPARLIAHRPDVRA